MNEFHMEQYKMLRDEIMYHLNETRKMELLAIGGVAGLYAWLGKNQGDINSSLWYIPTLIPFFGGFRSIMSLRRIKTIANYLQKIESRLFNKEEELVGWENYFKDKNNTKLRFSSVAYIFWIMLLFVTFIAPCFLRAA